MCPASHNCFKRNCPVCILAIRPREVHIYDIQNASFETQGRYRERESETEEIILTFHCACSPGIHFQVKTKVLI